MQTLTKLANGNKKHILQEGKLKHRVVSLSLPLPPCQIQITAAQLLKGHLLQWTYCLGLEQQKQCLCSPEQGRRSSRGGGDDGGGGGALQAFLQYTVFPRFPQY